MPRTSRRIVNGVLEVAIPKLAQVQPHRNHGGSGYSVRQPLSSCNIAGRLRRHWGRTDTVRPWFVRGVQLKTKGQRMNLRLKACGRHVHGGPPSPRPPQCSWGTVQAAASAAPLDAAPMPSLAPMVKRVSPSVVNIATRGTIKEKPGQRNPLLDDPFFRRFFDEPHERKFPERRLRRHRRRQERLHHHQFSRGRERQRNHRHAARTTAAFPPKVVGSDQGADIAVLQVKQPNLVAYRWATRPSSTSETMVVPSATRLGCRTPSPPASSVR